MSGDDGIGTVEHKQLTDKQDVFYARVGRGKAKSFTLRGETYGVTKSTFGKGYSIPLQVDPDDPEVERLEEMAKDLRAGNKMLNEDDTIYFRVKELPAKQDEKVLGRV